MPFWRRKAHFLRARTGSGITRLFMYVLLFGLAFVCIFPMLYVLSTSLMSNSDLGNIAVQWIPRGMQFENFVIAWDILDYPRFFRNSLFVTSIATLGHLISCSFIGYGFARFRFPFRNVLFVIMILSFIVPTQTIIVPLFMTYTRLNWTNTYLPLIVPTFLGFGLNGALFVFIFRQFYLTVPTDLENAAKIDGCGFIRTYFSIVFPLARAAIVVILVLSVVWHWNNHYEPSIYLRFPHLGFLPGRINHIVNIVHAPPEELFEMLGLIEDGEDTLNNAVVMAGTAIVIAPVLIFFAFTQRLFIQGIERAGITGE
jgi:multiple sugar transport system permease protein